jgi:protein-arginine kinase activator protein McsA
MESAKKPPECHSCQHPTTFTYKQIDKKRVECFGMCSSCPHKAYLLEQTIQTIVCSSCNKSLSDCLSSKKVGCLDCYVAFKESLHGVFQKIHLSIFNKQSAPLTQDMQELESSLRNAVAAEMFEEAAKLRDLLRKLSLKEEV